MPRRVPLGLLLFGTGLLLSSEGHASCMHSSLESQIRRAEIIFAGTVRRAEVTTSNWFGLLNSGGMPNSTRFVFERVRYAKGTGSLDSVSVIQMGGGSVMVSETVSFRVGARYIVLALKGPDDHPGSWTQMACATGHPFGVWPDSGETRSVARDDDGRPFLMFDPLHAVVLRQQPWSTDLVRRGNREGPPQPPLRRPSSEVIADLDSLGEFVGQPSYWGPPKPRYPGEGIRWASLFPHQDSGERVTEEQMLRVLGAIAAAPPPSRPEAR
jgi:hypothetical protein